MPEWVKILITAATGAILGITSNIAMEYLKPRIAIRHINKTVATQLVAERQDNLNAAEGAQRIVISAENEGKEAKNAAVQFATVVLRTVKVDRYKFYFAEHKAVVYKVDQAVERVLRHYRIGRCRDTYDDLKRHLHVATTPGHAFFQSRQLTYQASRM